MYTFGSRLIVSNPTGEEYEDKILLTVVLSAVSQKTTSRRSGGRDGLEFDPPSCRVQMNEIDNDQYYSRARSLRSRQGGWRTRRGYEYLVRYQRTILKECGLRKYMTVDTATGHWVVPPHAVLS